MREPITFVTFVYNDAERLSELLLTVRQIIGDGGEILVVDQSSTDDTRAVAERLADHVLTRRRKGFPDPDRTWAYAQAQNKWVLTLDVDEVFSEKLAKILPRLADDSHGVDLYWLRRENYIDGTDIFPILGDDWQPRLFKKGVLRYGDRMHTHPEIGSPKQMWVTTGAIVHERTLAGVENASKNRALQNDPQMRQLEENFAKRVKSLLGVGREYGVDMTRLDPNAGTETYPDILPEGANDAEGC